MDIQIGDLYKNTCSNDCYAFIEDVKENKVYYTFITSNFYYKATHGMKLHSFIEIFKHDYRRMT
jgi:hypothetical protein